MQSPARAARVKPLSEKHTHPISLLCSRARLAFSLMSNGQVTSGELVKALLKWKRNDCMSKAQDQEQHARDTHCLAELAKAANDHCL